MFRKTIGMAVISAGLLFAAACERTPESLEEWRNAEGGYEKMAEWATSAEESEAVRIRAVQILIEEHQTTMLGPLMEQVSDEAMRQKLTAGALPTIEAMWAKADWPKIDPDAADKGLVRVSGESESIEAKDAAFYLHPYASDADRARLEAILAQWMSEDQDIRTQLGNTTVDQAASRAGKEGIPMMLKWVESTANPANVVEKIMRATKDGGDDSVAAALADAIRKRCEAEHPNLSDQTEGAMLRVTHPNIAPYLEMAIEDPQSPPKLVDAAMDVLVKSKGDKSTEFFVRQVTQRDGLMRWVSATRLIELRGKAGVLAAAKALPLEPETYSTPKADSFKEESETFCNFVSTELKEQGVDSAQDVVTNLLASDRWPARTLGLRCAEITKESGAKSTIEGLAEDKTPIPGWGEDKTIGQLATEVAQAL